MFTGIIEELGTVREKSSTSLDIESSFANNLKLGDSVSVNGACLTVEKILNKDIFRLEIMEETKKKTNLGKIRVGEKVNLERALSVGDRLNGHFVSGHVDNVGKIKNIFNLNKSKIFEVSFDKKMKKFLVEKGSVTVDGISLTVMSLTSLSFSFSAVGFTLKNTNLHHRKVGGRVNLEFDLLAKHVVNFLKK